MTDDIHIVVEGQAPTTNQSYRIVRFGKRAGMAKTKECKAWQADLEASARQTVIMTGRRCPIWPFEALAVAITFTHGDNRPRDIDGSIKPALDALQEVIYKNDRQICELTVRRMVELGKPKTTIVVMRLGD